MAKQGREKRTFWLIDRSSTTFSLFPFETSRHKTLEDGRFVVWFGHCCYTVGENCWDDEHDADEARRGLILNEIQALSDRIRVLAGCLY